jgi:hypothetical protein
VGGTCRVPDPNACPAGDGAQATRLAANPNLGRQCGDDCRGTFCQAAGPAIFELCAGSDLPLPCVGTATGQFCSRSCREDRDCDNARTPMRCLTSCPGLTNAVGKCLEAGDHAFLVSRVCTKSAAQHPSRRPPIEFEHLDAASARAARLSAIARRWAAPRAGLVRPEGE